MDSVMRHSLTSMLGAAAGMLGAAAGAAAGAGAASGGTLKVIRPVLVAAAAVFEYARRVRISASGLDGQGPLIGAGALVLR